MAKHPARPASSEQKADAQHPGLSRLAPERHSAGENFSIRQSELVEPRDGQFLVRNDFLSVEPAMRGWVSAVANYSTPVGIGEVMRSFAAGGVSPRNTRSSRSATR